ncbi:MAG TPA: hypothetical protein VL026_05055 [Rhizomicrobium sp.]|nr:hypothetical protein [Rhizomicrobium sp.]
MTAPTDTTPPSPRRKTIVLVLVAAGIVLLLGANAHMAYVAVTSQPDCVPHAKEVGVDGVTFRAARPAC